LLVFGEWAAQMSKAKQSKAGEQSNQSRAKIRKSKAKEQIKDLA
jgi:hypothetical protein